MKIVLALAVLAAAVVAEEKYSTENDDFDVDALVANLDELRKFSGCFLDKNTCDEVAADFKKDIPESFKEACLKCTDAQKHIFKRFLAGIKEKLPQDFAEFKKKYDSEGKFYTALEKAIENAYTNTTN